MDKYFNVDVDEMMIDYSEMTGFDFGSPEFQEIKREVLEYAKQPNPFLYGNFDMVDFFRALHEGA